MPISPVHAFSFLNDKVPEERNRVIDFCDKLVEIADEIWFFGDCSNSEGCQLEKEVAVRELVTIRVVKGWDANNYPIFEHEAPKWLKLRTEPAGGGQL